MEIKIKIKYAQCLYHSTKITRDFISIDNKTSL